jgi:(5-formylfuran-3-yl)methyl phosphate synthase
MRLLVSVTDPGEVRAAIEGGADIIDAKDASRGALGAVAPSVLRGIIGAVGGARPVSVALGDVGAADSSVTRRRAEPPMPGVSFVKLGFAAGVDQREAAAYVRSVVASLAGTPTTAVVLAAYADAGPDRLGRDQVVEIATQCGVAGVLLDTLAKQQSQPLFALLGLDAVAAWVATAHRAGLSVALAGSLGAPEMAVARDIGADVVGVRGAACDGGRLGRVSADRVRGLVGQIAADLDEAPRSVPAMTPVARQSLPPTRASASARV